MKVLVVTGSRDHRDKDLIWGRLDAAADGEDYVLLAHGAARGADRLAAAWADYNGHPELRVPARWRRDGRKAAGPRRNARLLDLVWQFRHGHLDPVTIQGLAFPLPGSVGTHDMIDRLNKANVPVEVYLDSDHDPQS